MHAHYARDLDLNLLRVFVVVAEHASVTHAAARLYLTQPAVSAALRRLTAAVGAPLFVRQGRGLALTARGTQLLAGSQVHLAALIDAALAPAELDPRTSERTLRLGMADAAELWILPAPRDHTGDVGGRPRARMENYVETRATHWARQLRPSWHTIAADGRR
ncbi:MAG TPA: LysR family transcriptional regulator [Kofleriaceae bacterium]|jgi:LysR family transcriptional activator of mexEF-oprN operon|nr:LysR family transcriptional regulator [Kofleriaceae bacterium]